jgi:hypothetical protein
MTDVQKPDLAARLEAVFGGLGSTITSQSHEGTQSWNLQINIPAFHTGASNLDVYSSDEEAEASAPRPFPLEYSEDGDEEVGRQGLRSDDDGVLPRPSFGEERRQEELFLSTCSAQFRKAFEAEEEEDDYDRVAVGSTRTSLRDSTCNEDIDELHVNDLGKPAGDTEVRRTTCYFQIYLTYMQCCNHKCKSIPQHKQCPSLSSKPFTEDLIF